MMAIHYILEFTRVQNDMSNNNSQSEQDILAILREHKLECEEVRFSEGSDDTWSWNFFGNDFQFRILVTVGSDSVIADLLLWKKAFRPGSLFVKLKKFLKAGDYFLMEMKRKIGSAE